MCKIKVRSTILILSHKEGVGSWKNRVGPFYKTKTDWHELKKEAEKDFDMTIARAKDELSDTLLLMDFGEMSASWYLEKKRKMVFLKLRWVEEPFTTKSGADIICIDNGTWGINYAEIKASRRKHNLRSVACCSRRSLSSQLDEERLDKRFHNQRAIPDSKIRIMRSIKELVQNGTIARDDAIFTSIRSATSYGRYGFVVHPSPLQGDALFESAVKKIGSAPVFVDFAYDNFEEELRHFKEDSRL